MGKIICTAICLIFILWFFFFGCSSPKDRVYCPKCHKSLTKEVKICPKDQAPLNGYKYWFWSRGRPLPKMAYPAETYLIKNNKGNFVWYPFEVDLHDFDSI